MSTATSSTRAPAAMEVAHGLASSPAHATSPAMRLLDRYLSTAADARASDLHFEPAGQQLRVRMRVDGMLRELDPPPAALVAALAARARVLARVDLSQQRLPQDGRFVFRWRSRAIEVRAAFMPVYGGEKIALRLLDGGAAELPLSQLGMSDQDLDCFDTALSKTNGLLLVVGATGSGKTTTLYAALERLRSPERSILTVEDPVERDLEGISQAAVDDEGGRSFAVVLRAVLRQDPDVLMIGEIRDPDTARIACRAALTGHLVLSTLHTADTEESLIRLTEMGVPAYLVGATISLVVAQRLLRRLCARCAGTHAPSVGEAELYHSRGLAVPSYVGSANGCERCGGTGFAGRLGVFELRDCQRAHGDGNGPLQCLIDAGLARAALGQTTVAEVLARCPDPSVKHARNEGSGR